MYLYKEEDNRRNHLWGALAMLAYFAVWVAAILLIRFHFEKPDLQGEGIMINFGDVESAGGDQDPMLADNFSQAASVPSEAGEQQMLTQDHEDAPAIAPPAKKPQQTVQPTTTPTTQTSTTPAQPAREVNRAALFPGSTPASTSTSEGTGTGMGNQGDPAGSPTGSHDGTGTGTSGVSFNLSGRQPVGTLQRPDFPRNERITRKVNIRITVNPAGAVVAAEFSPEGSTTTDMQFINSALIVARKSRFTPTDADNNQQGTITYVFIPN